MVIGLNALEIVGHEGFAADAPGGQSRLHRSNGALVGERPRRAPRHPLSPRAAAQEQPQGKP